MITDILFYLVFSRCPCSINGRISPVKMSLTPALSSPSSFYSLLAHALQDLIFLIMSPNRLDHNVIVCFLYCYNLLVIFLSSLFISLANLDSSPIIASATVPSSPTSSYLFITSLFFLRSYLLEFFILSPSMYYFVYFLHGVCYVSWLYYFVVKDGRLFNFLCAIKLLYDHPVILTPNATDQSPSGRQRARNYNVDITHACSNGIALVKIRIVVTIITLSGISLESHSLLDFFLTFEWARLIFYLFIIFGFSYRHLLDLFISFGFSYSYNFLFSNNYSSNSSELLVPLPPTASDQSASNQRAPNYNVDLLSNQLDSTQPFASSELQDDKISISNSNSFQLETNQLAPRDWAALDHGLISEIVERLPTDEDFFSFKYVCRWCRFICSGMNWTTNPQLPWLMLSEKVDSNMRSFYSFEKNKHYEIELRAARQRRCFASPHGWIATLTPHGKIHILNPLSQDRKMLPLLRASNNPRAVGDWFQYIHKLMVFKSSPNEFLVMAIYGSRNRLAFVRFGEQKWNTVKDASEIRDVALFGGEFYALRAFGTLVCIEFRGVARAIFIAPPPPDAKIPAEVYLVKSSSGDLLGVFRFGIVLERRRETENFLVYRFDFESEEWVGMEELGECALFVGEGNSWCIRATNAKHGNRIYYADDYWNRQRRGEVTPNGHDIGVFSMESGEIELLNFGMDFPCEFSRPGWFTPNLRSSFFPY